MATLFITDTELENIADAIRAKNGSQLLYTPAQMATAISNLDTSGSGSGSGSGNEGVSPITVNITQSANQTIMVDATVNSTVTLTSNGGSVTVPQTVTLSASIIPDNGYLAGTLNQSSVSATWGDTVSFSATAATQAQAESWRLVGTYSNEGLTDVTKVDFGVRQSSMKIDQQVDISGATSLMTSLEFHTDAPLAWDPLEGFEFSDQTHNHNNASWSMSESDLDAYTSTQQVSERQAGIQQWCTDGTHGSQWNVQVGSIYVTKINYVEPISKVTYAQWIDGSGNNNRKFYAGGVRFTTTGAHVINYYHKLYLDS
jgi:hypothetical protein